MIQEVESPQAEDRSPAPAASNAARSSRLLIGAPYSGKEKGGADGRPWFAASCVVSFLPRWSMQSLPAGWLHFGHSTKFMASVLSMLLTVGVRYCRRPSGGTTGILRAPQHKSRTAPTARHRPRQCRFENLQVSSQDHPRFLV